jgi:hypothetical protein
VMEILTKTVKELTGSGFFTTLIAKVRCLHSRSVPRECISTNLIITIIDIIIIMVIIIIIIVIIVI